MTAMIPVFMNLSLLFYFRIRKEKAGGAWCPKTQIAHNVYEYLQVDLGEVKVISLVETQGRFGNGQVSKKLSLNLLYFL